MIRASALSLLTTAFALFGCASSPLIDASGNGRTAQALDLLKKGANPNELDKWSGFTPLSIATVNGHKDTVAALLGKGADVQEANALGLTALHWAALVGRADIAKLLLSKGANVDAKDNWGDTPILLGAQKGRTDVVRLLLQSTATVDALGVVLDIKGTSVMAPTGYEGSGCSPLMAAPCPSCGCSWTRGPIRAGERAPAKRRCCSPRRGDARTSSRNFSRAA